MAQADGAAPAAGGIAVDLRAAGNVDLAPTHQNRAAVQTGGIAGDLRAAGNVDLTIAAHIDGAASGIVVALGRFIAGDGAAGHVDGAAGGGEECAAVLGGVILDGAAVHIESAAGGVRHVCIEFPENGTAVVIAVVAGDFATVHIEYALLVIQSDGSAAAFAGDFAAGELAAEHIQRAVVEVDAHAAPTRGSALDGAAALTVTENKSTAVFDLDFSGTVAGKGLAVQAQVKGFAVHRQMTADGGVARQIDVGGIVRIRNAVRAVPRLIGHVGMAGMISRRDAASADAVLVLICQQGDARFIGLHRRSPLRRRLLLLLRLFRRFRFRLFFRLFRGFLRLLLLTLLLLLLLGGLLHRGRRAALLRGEGRRGQKGQCHTQCQ